MTISIEIALMQLLKTSPTVFDLIGDRIGPSMAMNTLRPFVIYTRYIADHQRHLGGASGAVFVRVQLDLFADSVLDLVELSEAIRNRVDGYQGTVAVGNDEVRFQQIALRDERTDALPPNDASDAGPHHHLLDFFCSAFESVPTLT